MAGFRAIREEARAALHEGLSVPALYIESTGAEPEYIHVRVHTTWGQVGDVKGTSYAYAELQDTKPKLIFLVAEVPEPYNGAIISIAPGEAYRIDNVLPPENITVAAEVHRVSASTAAGLPVPPPP